MKHTNKYIKECRILLPMYGKNEKRFINDLKSSIEIDHNNCSYDELVEILGTPGETVSSYISEVDSERLCTLIRKRNIFKWSALFICAVILSVSVFKAACIYDDYIESKNAIVTKEETTIIDYGEDNEN